MEAQTDLSGHCSLTLSVVEYIDQLIDAYHCSSIIAYHYLSSKSINLSTFKWMWNGIMLGRIDLCGHCSLTLLIECINQMIGAYSCPLSKLINWSMLKWSSKSVICLVYLGFFVVQIRGVFLMFYIRHIIRWLLQYKSQVDQLIDAACCWYPSNQRFLQWLIVKLSSAMIDSKHGRYSVGYQ